VKLEKRQWSKPDKEEISGQLSLYLFYFSGHLQAIGFRRGDFPKADVSDVGQPDLFWKLIYSWKAC
jgi:hypothetical protein